MLRPTVLCSAVLAALALAACGVASGAPERAPKWVAVDDATQGQGNFRFLATGRWERVRGRADGRSAGTSTRSMHRSDVLALTFSGTGVRLDAVAGPTNGYALVELDGAEPEVVDFYAARKRTHALVWHREGLVDGIHTVTVAVLGRHAKPSRGDYVNVDDAAVLLSGSPQP